MIVSVRDNGIALIEGGKYCAMNLEDFEKLPELNYESMYESLMKPKRPRC